MLTHMIEICVYVVLIDNRILLEVKSNRQGRERIPYRR